ncbi:hypothetical protein JCM10449v2_007526 [Rhodotorula kratochvilovae]
MTDSPDYWSGEDASIGMPSSHSSVASGEGQPLLPVFPPFHLPNGRLRIPTHLPPNPDFLPVQLDDLDVDDELVNSGATLEFTVATLQNSAHTLIQASHATGGKDNEPFTSPASAFPLVRCTRPPPPLPFPTHLLELHFADTGERYRTPVHGLLWALQSPRLPHLCRRFVAPASLSGDDHSTDGVGTLSNTAAAARAREDELLLPLVTLAMPCRAAWPLLHRFLYDGSAAQLLNGLLSVPEPLPQRALDLRSAPDPAQPALDSLLVRLMRVREVWIDAHALELSNRHLWDTLDRAYTILVAELVDTAAGLPGCTVPSRGQVDDDHAQ